MVQHVMITLNNKFAGGPLVLCLKHVLGLIVKGCRSDHQNVHIALLYHLVLVVARQLLGAFEPAEALWRSRHLHLEPGLILLIHLNVAQRCKEVQRKFCRKTQRINV